MILDGRTAELTAERPSRCGLRPTRCGLNTRRRCATGCAPSRACRTTSVSSPRPIPTRTPSVFSAGPSAVLPCCTHGRQPHGQDRSFLDDEPMEPDGEALAALVQQYYEGRGTYPRQVLLPCALEGQDALERLAHRGGGAQGRARRAAARRQVPPDGDGGEQCARGDPHRNDKGAAQPQKRSSGSSARWSLTRRRSASRRLTSQPWRHRHRRRYDRVPARAAAQVGLPEVPHPTTDGQNDYGSMHEAVTRRFQHYVDGDPGFCPLPDLLLIDGGAEHASVAQAVLDGFGLQVPVFGMVRMTATAPARSSRPAGMRSASPPTPRCLAPSSVPSRRRRTVFPLTINAGCGVRVSSELDQIPAWARRRNALLKAFRSVRAIRAASYEELCAAVPAGVARAVYDHYHPKGEPPCA